MEERKLTFLFSIGKNDKYVFESDERTNELYLNGRKIVTEMGFSKTQKILGWLVSLAIIVQGLMAILAFIFRN